MRTERERRDATAIFKREVGMGRNGKERDVVGVGREKERGVRMTQAGARRRALRSPAQPSTASRENVSISR